MPPAPKRPSQGRPLRRDALIALACVAAGVAFSGGIWRWKGPEAAQQYIASYLIELSLSVDNVFVFALVFAQFGLDPRRQGRLLFWGILGAIVLRSAFILAGLGAIARFAWLIPVFGALILVTGLRLAFFHKTKQGLNPQGRLYSLVLRHLPVALAALVVLETADLVFALDSLPAVLAVTHDPFIAIASNFFAILGLRSLFSLVSGAMKTLRFLNGGLAAVLSFVGLKMLAEPWYPLPIGLSLAVIAALLGGAVGASLLWPKPPAARP